jgi:WD40 repeat protein
LLVVRGDHGVVVIYDLEARRAVERIEGGIATIAVHSEPGDERLYLVGRRGEVNCRSLETLDRLERFEIDLPAATMARVSPDGATLAVAGRTVGLFDTDGGTDRLAALEEPGHRAPVTSVSPMVRDTNVIATGSREARNVHFWDELSGERLQTLSGGGTFAISPNGEMLASAHGAEIRVWRIDDGRRVQTMGEGDSEVASMCFSPGGSLLAVGDTGTDVRVWNVRSGTQTQSHPIHEGVVTAVTFDSEAHLLYSASADGTIRQWDLHLGAEVGRFEGHTATVTDLALFGGERFLVSSGLDDSLRIWRAETHAEQHVIDAEQGGVTGLALAPDESGLVSAGSDGTVAVWRVGSWHEVGRFEAHPGGVHDVALLGSGDELLTAGEDHCALIWTLDQISWG